MLRIAALVIVLLTGRVAFADEAAPPPPDDGYGTHVLVADLIAPVMFTAAQWRTRPFVDLGISAYVLGGPVVHTAHRRYRRAATSLGLRIGLPIAGLFAGDLVHHLISSGDPHVWEAWDGPPSPLWILGAAAGFVGAIVIDQRVLAGGYTRKRTAVVPSATAGNGGVTLGIIAAF